MGKSFNRDAHSHDEKQKIKENEKAKRGLRNKRRIVIERPTNTSNSKPKDSASYTY